MATDGLSEAYESKQWDVFCENNDLLLENDRLKAENAELRSLVSGLMCCPVHRDDCVKWKCKHLKVVSKEENGNWPRYVCTLCERAKEMGIEVDG